MSIEDGVDDVRGQPLQPDQLGHMLVAELSMFCSTLHSTSFRRAANGGRLVEKGRVKVGLAAALIRRVCALYLRGRTD